MAYFIHSKYSFINKLLSSVLCRRTLADAADMVMPSKLTGMLARDPVRRQTLGWQGVGMRIASKKRFLDEFTWTDILGQYEALLGRWTAVPEGSVPELLIR
jgi:hypothetical protein